ncbi:MAG: PPC domain-containing protein [Spirochaetota bacterium]
MNLRVLLLLSLMLIPLTGVLGQDVILSEEGEVRFGDSRYEDGRFVDWYDVSVPRGQRLVAHVVSADFTPAIVIEGPDGPVEYPGTRFGAEAATQFLRREPVRIGVTTVPEEGSAEGVYSIRVRLYPAGPTLGAGSVEQGLLERSDEHLPDQRAVDWYPLEVSSGQRLFITMESPSLDTYLLLRYPDGTERFNDDFQNSDAGIHVTAGQDMLLQLGATTFSENSYGDYTILVQETEPPDEVRVGRTIRGSLDSDAGGMDVYSLYGRTGDMIVVEASSNDFDTYLMLREPSGFTVQNDDREPGITDSRLMYTFSRDEAVEIEVSAFGAEESGRYTLTVTEFVLDDNVEEVVDGRPLEDGEEVMALMTGEQRFTIRALANHRIVLEMSSDFFDTYLTVIGPSGQEYTNDDGFAGSTNSLLDVVAPETGTYDVYAGSFSGNGTGLYSVSYQAGGEVRLLARFSGELDTTAPRDSEGKRFRRHSFDGRAGQYVTIDLTSGAFDTYLILEGPEGFVVAENDDYSAGTDSRISRELDQNGRYTVVVQGYSEDAEGPYEVVISE